MVADRDDRSELPEPDRPASDRVAERPATDGTVSGPELRERQLAEHARYRVVVEATMSRETWARAAPELEAEWTEHKRRYPAPDRQSASTQPDGSWHGDGGRRLSPEQHAETAKCAADLRDEARQSIRPAMERIAAADSGRRLAGLDYMLKGEDRLKEKVADTLQAARTHGQAGDRKRARSRSVYAVLPERTLR